MKLTKKKVFLIALAISLVAILSMGTLAWFNATSDITNDFMVATDENDTDPTFTVEVSETGLDGQPTTTGNKYYDVVPGDVIDKDPTITNTGDYTQWIRVSVTMTEADDWAANGGSLKFTDIFAGSTYGLAADVATSTATWLLVDETVTADATTGEAVWYLYLREELEAGDAVVLFEEVSIEEDFTLDEIMGFGGDFSITVHADALQRDNTGNTAVEAFDNVGWDAGDAFVDTDVVN